jgi:hypothetical protein
MIKQFFKYLLSKTMKKTYSIVFALLLLCITVASASAFTLMPNDVVINGQNMVLVTPVMTPNLPLTTYNDIFEGYFYNIDQIILKRNDLQKQYHNSKQSFYDIRNGVSKFNVCDLQNSIDFIRDRTTELEEQTITLKYNVWGMKPNPGTTELETKSLVMKKLNSEVYRTEQLDNNVANLQKAVSIACTQEKEQGTVTPVIPEDEPEVNEPGLDYYTNRYELFNHAYHALNIYSNKYITALESNDFSVVCKSDVPLEEVVSKSKILRTITLMLVEKVSSLETESMNEAVLKDSLLEKAKALDFKVRKLSIDSEYLLKKYPENFCDNDNTGNDADDTDDNTDNNQDNGIDVTQEQDLFDYLSEALTVLTASFDETKINITEMYCNGQETEAQEEKEKSATTYGMTYVFYHGASASTQTSLTEKGADDLASQFEQLVTDYETFGMDIAEFGNLVFTSDVCSTDITGDNTDNQNSDNQTDNSQDNEQSDVEKLVEYENQFDAFDEEYDDLRNDLEEAEDDNDEDEIDDIKDDLSDLYDDVDGLYDELIQFKGIVPEHLKDDVSDLKDDVKELKNKIKCLKNEDSNSCGDSNDDYSDYSYEYTPSSTTTNNNQNAVVTKQVEEVDLITTSVQPPQELASGSTNSIDNDVVKFTESSTYFAMLISGFIMLLGIAVFLGAIVVRLY